MCVTAQCLCSVLMRGPLCLVSPPSEPDAAVVLLVVTFHFVAILHTGSHADTAFFCLGYRAPLIDDWPDCSDAACFRCAGSSTSLLETLVLQFYYLDVILIMKTKATVRQAFQQRHHFVSVNYYYMYLHFSLNCGCTTGAHLPLLVLHSRIMCFWILTRYLRRTVMISYWLWQSRLTITDYAVSFPFAVGPWAGRNSSIDMGSIEVGRRVTQEVPPGVFWRSLLHLGLPQFLKFNISLGKDALFGVYIRKGLPPSHAQVHAPECRFHICIFILMSQL